MTITIIDLYLLLPLNALFIFGISAITTYEEDADGTISDRMALWFVRRWCIKNLGVFWSKPFVLCPPCMASVWGTIFYFTFLLVFQININIFAVIIWPFYCVTLSGLNYGLQRYIN